VVRLCSLVVNAQVVNKPITGSVKSSSMPAFKAISATIVACLLLAVVPAAASAAPPDPMARGTYTPITVDPVKAGTVALQEPSATGTAPGTPGSGSGGGTVTPGTNASSAVTVQLRGTLTYPLERTSGSPIIVLVHGNHASCHNGTAPNCTVFSNSARGYAYLAENLATWGYTVFSIDQDQLIFYQDNTAKGMHQRRLIIAATLDALYDANQAPTVIDADHNIGSQLVGRLDFTRIGLMGHSRGGDAVTSFLDFNRTRPAPGRRYTGIRAVIAVAPTDYERKAPYGVAYDTLIGYCDGDVSNLMGTRFYERSQYIAPDDPYPRMQSMLHGADHNFFNSEWFVDGDDSTTSDPACSTNATTNPNNIRLSGGTYTRTVTTTPTVTDSGTYGSGDPALMGDQERAGLAVMASFFRRYVGSELAFDPYETGELSQDGVTPQLPATACPNQNASATRISCFDRFQQDYFAPPAERRDVIRPEPDEPLTLSALGTSITGSGFSNPYLAGGGVTPIPPTTPGGYDWCNPEPDHFTPSNVQTGAGNPTAFKACPLPGAAALGGQNGTRENAPVNHSYGLQYALAWDGPASLSTRIPADSGDVTQYKSLTLAAAVNFFDPRNPSRGTIGLWNPGAPGVSQDFDVVVTDSAGHTATVSAASPRYGTALHQTVGNTTVRVHVVLNSIRIPVTDFAAQGVDLTHLTKLELKFGGPGKPATGSIELADVRFQESVTGPTALRDQMAAATAAAHIEATPRAAPGSEPDVVPVSDAPVPASIKAICAGPSVTSLRLRASRLAITGSAGGTGCSSAIRTVIVRLFKTTGTRCRFARINGTLGRAMPCSSRVGLAARGTSAWSLRITRALAKGTYHVDVLSIDKAGRQRATVKTKTVKVR
jgi:hypothetical protein